MVLLNTTFLFFSYTPYREDDCYPWEKRHLRVKCGEWLKVGDVITYKCEVGNIGYLTSEIRKIVLEDENPLKLDDYGIVWYHNAFIQKVKTVVNGRLEDNPTAKLWREVAEFHLEEGEAHDFGTRKSKEAQRLSGIMSRLSDGISNCARKLGLPQDLTHSHVRGNKADSSSENEEDEEDNNSGTTRSSQRNYYKEFAGKATLRKDMEAVAAQEQQKQAEAVNKGRSWEGGEHLPKGTVCLLSVGEDKNNVGVKDLPVVITGLNYYSTSGAIRYRVASKDAYISGTFSRGDLRPQEHVTPQLMGINLAELDRKKGKTLTPIQAHNRYTPIGGKNQKCRCRTDCRYSKKCGCRDAGRLCNKHCHKNNTLCTWCTRM